jgi:uncharacterized membrane protein (DUF2068 family)
VREPFTEEEFDSLAPVTEQVGGAAADRWTRRLVLFLRAMAIVSLLKGLYHWAHVCGIAGDDGTSFDVQPIAWQAATIFFAVLDLVAAVGLWLAAAWGAVIWLMAVASMLAVEIAFPQVFGGGLAVVGTEALLLVIYLVLALKAAQEHPA